MGTNNINCPPMPPQVFINIMTRHIPIGNVPPLVGNPPPLLYSPSWRARNIIVVLGPMQNLPRHLEKYITKFDPKCKDFAEEHLLRYTVGPEALQIQHEGCYMQIVLIFNGRKASSWFFSLVVGSITSWDQLERLLLTKYGIKKIPSAIVQELSSIKMNKK